MPLPLLLLSLPPRMLMPLRLQDAASHVILFARCWRAVTLSAVSPMADAAIAADIVFFVTAYAALIEALSNGLMLRYYAIMLRRFFADIAAAFDERHAGCCRRRYFATLMLI